MTTNIKPHPAGVRALLRSREIMADLKRRGQRIDAAAGPGHEVESFQGRNRNRVTVRTTTDKAAIAEQVHKNLTKAISAGR